MYWLVLNRPEVDLCLKPTGHDVDLIVKADLRALTAVWMGDITLLDATRSKRISIDGPRQLVRSFPRWLAFSPFAGVPRPVSRPARTTVIDSSPRFHHFHSLPLVVPDR